MISVKKLIILLAVTVTISGCAYHADIVRAPDTPLYRQTVIFNNVRYIPLLRFCDYYDLDWDWDMVSQRIELKSGGNTVVLKPNSYFALVNNKYTELDYPIEYRNGAAYIPAKDALFLSDKIFGMKAPVLPGKIRHQIRTVVIDPGHGGRDPGAVSRYGTREKDIVLDISKKLKMELEKSGIKAYLTRKKDIFIPLYKRATFANDREADLFISVHANAARYSRATGFEVFYLSEATDDNARALAAAENEALKFEDETLRQGKTALSADPTVCDLILSENRRVSKELAYYIYNITSDRMGMKKRGVKGARFAVLKGTMMPAVLVEVGFLTNWREESKLKKTSFRDRIANAISRSILAYKGEYERANGFTR